MKNPEKRHHLVTVRMGSKTTVAANFRCKFCGNYYSTTPEHWIVARRGLKTICPWCHEANFHTGIAGLSAQDMKDILEYQDRVRADLVAREKKKVVKKRKVR